MSFFSFRGRLGRNSYFHWWILLIPASLIPLLGIILFLPLTVKRLHDLNHSGWKILWMMFPFVGLVITLWLLSRRGTVGPNRFGEDPELDLQNAVSVLDAVTVLEVQGDYDYAIELLQAAAHYPCDELIRQDMENYIIRLQAKSASQSSK